METDNADLTTNSLKYAVNMVKYESLVVSLQEKNITPKA